MSPLSCESFFSSTRFGFNFSTGEAKHDDLRIYSLNLPVILMANGMKLLAKANG